VRRGVAASLALAGALVLLVSAAQAAPPPNDAFAAALELVGESGTVSGTTAEATKEPGEAVHAGNPGGRSVWYRWTAPFSGSALIETCGSGFDTLLAVYAGAVASALTPVAANDDACGEQSRLIATVTAGTTYSIVVDGFGGVSGAFTLRWSAARPPANDNFAAAQQLTGAVGALTGTNLGASVEPGEIQGGGASVWYVWTPPVAGGAFVETCGSSFDTVLAVFTGSTLQQVSLIGANDDACNVSSRVHFRAEAGTTYRILVDGLLGGTGEFALRWNVSTPPGNDQATRARRISGARGSVAGTTVGATKDSGEAQHAGAIGGASVWYRWRAPRAGSFAFDTCAGIRFDTVLAVYRRGARNRLVGVAADDDGCRRNAGSLAIVATKAGQEYLIAVDGLAGASGAFRLKWGKPPSWIPCVVPNVRGQRLERARNLVARANCSVGRIGRATSTVVPRGVVITQFPEPGTRLRFGGRVHLEISSGRGR
jgi:hypothetical protein